MGLLFDLQITSQKSTSLQWKFTVEPHTTGIESKEQ